MKTYEKTYEIVWNDGHVDIMRAVSSWHAFQHCIRVAGMDEYPLSIIEIG